MSLIVRPPTSNMAGEYRTVSTTLLTPFHGLLPTMRSNRLTASVVAIVALWATSCGKPRVVPPTSPFPPKGRWEMAPEAPLSSALASDGTSIFAALSNGSVVALDPASGGVLWTRTGLGPGLVAARAGSLVLVERSGTVWGLSPVDGTARWKTGTSVTDVLSVRLDANRVFLGGASGLAAVIVSTGEVRFDLAATDVMTIDVAGDFLTAIEGGALVERGREDGAVVFRVESPEGKFGAPALFADGRVVVGSGTRLVRAVSQKGKFGWRFKVGARVQDRPLDFGDHKRVGIISFEGVFYEVSLGGGDMRRRVLLPSRPYGPAMLVGDRVFAPIFEDEIVVIDPRTTKLVGRTKLGGGFLSQPLLVGGRLVAEISSPRRLVGLELVPGP